LPALCAGDRILVGRQEWGGNVSTYSAAAARAGATLAVIPSRDDGSVDPRALANMIDSKVRLVSLTWVPANGGLVNDAEAIGAVTREAGVPYFIDAGQALGQMPVDVAALQCDVLKGTCRKYLRGPRGTALLYVRRDFVSTLEPAFLDVGSGPWDGGKTRPREDARVFETVEMSAALLLGAGAALEQARQIGIANIQARVVALAESLRRRLRGIGRVKVLDLGTRHCGLVSFTVDGLSMLEVRQRLAAQRIVVGGNGTAYTPFDMAARNLEEIVRASISYFNTDEELDQLAQAVERLARH
jgi:cysteine desulfurase/selenocysteine lyase